MRFTYIALKIIDIIYLIHKITYLHIYHHKLINTIKITLFFSSHYSLRHRRQTTTDWSSILGEKACWSRWEELIWKNWKSENSNILSSTLKMTPLTMEEGQEPPNRHALPPIKFLHCELGDFDMHPSWLIDLSKDELSFRR